MPPGEPCRTPLLIKVCCIQDEAELVLAASEGASHGGLVAEMPSGPGPIGDDDIAHLAAMAPRSLTPVLLTARTEPAAIAEHVRRTGVRAVQLVQHVPRATRVALRRTVPGVEIIQVLHVEGPSSLDAARDAAVEADYLLLDSGRPCATIAELGGTGRTHDWSVSAAIVSAASVPVFLAGGLRPENVGAAIAAVRPAGVDLCSGIRDRGGRLAASRLSDFITEVRRY